MDSAELLDLLGNDNRRRILRLLSHKPCYVTEISEYLGVSPKAVIDHLRRLEAANLVESHTDDGRRKYFSIARNVRLEVRVSPYQFGTKSGHPASRSFDMSSCRYVSIDVAVTGEDEESDELQDLAARLERLEQLENELSLAQRWVQGRATDIRQQFNDVVDDGDGRLLAEVVAAISNGAHEVSTIARSVDAPDEIVEEALSELDDHGVVERDGQDWTLRE